MEQDLLVGARKQAEALEEAVAEDVWVAIIQDQDPVGSVSARSAAREYNISGGSLVIQQVVRSAEQKW